jgi:predicted peroxiredoxin
MLLRLARQRTCRRRRSPSPNDPISEPAPFMSNGGTVWACPPCSKLRNYDEGDFIDGVKITGAGPVYDVLKSGASTISF